MPYSLIAAQLGRTTLGNTTVRGRRGKLTALPRVRVTCQNKSATAATPAAAPAMASARVASGNTSPPCNTPGVPAAKVMIIEYRQNAVKLTNPTKANAIMVLILTRALQEARRWQREIPTLPTND
ncbi:MAG: hypothetical protein ABIZ81_14850 [Opitutaceae bacterium]